MLSGGIATTAELDDGLLAFGRAWALLDPRVVRHFDLVRQIEAEIGHVPAAAIQAWQDDARHRRGQPAPEVRPVHPLGVVGVVSGPQSTR